MLKFAKAAVATLVLVLFVSPVYAAESAPMEVEGAQRITAAEAKALFDKGVIFVDVRGDADYNAGRIPEAEHLHVDSKLTDASLGALVKKGGPVVFYCNGTKCGLSPKACAKAVAWGYTNVKYFRGGFPEWKAAGYPVE